MSDNAATRPTARLEGWVRHQQADSVVTFSGRVYGHSRFHDGDVVMTSRVVSHHGGVVQTRNTDYTLGLSLFEERARMRMMGESEE